MNVEIELSREDYDKFLASCDTSSWEHSILMNTIVPGQDEPTIAIVCEKEEAVRLVHAALRFYPPALTPISEALGRVL
jgi:hypothetical protein